MMYKIIIKYYIKIHRLLGRLLANIHPHMKTESLLNLNILHRPE